MDIDALLASVGPGRGGHQADRDLAAEAGSLAHRDLRALTRAWVNEKSAPEILPWPTQLMERVMTRIQKQVQLVEDQATLPDPKTSFRLIILQTELERFKFLVRSFLRARIAKIDRYALYYLSDTAARDRLSPSELEYATAHQSLLSSHYQAAFLAQFPSSLQRLDDTAGGIAMVERPDVDCAVFVRGLANEAEPIRVPGTDIAFELRRGDIYVVRWRAVQEIVEAGKAELI